MVVRSAVLMAFLGLMILYTFQLRDEESAVAAAEARLTHIPLTVAGYDRTNEAIDAGTLQHLGADRSVFRKYRNKFGRPIWVFLGYFGAPREDSPVQSPMHCFPGAGWKISEESTLHLNYGGRDLSVTQLVTTDGRERRLVLYWFETDAGVITNEYALKWNGIKNAFFNGPRRLAFVRFSTVVERSEEPEAASAELLRFIEEIAPHVAKAIGSAEQT